MSELLKNIVRDLGTVKVSKRVAQKHQEEMAPKKDPNIAHLNAIYEALSNSDEEEAFKGLMSLTKSLKLEDEVSYDVSDEDEDPSSLDEHDKAPEADHGDESHLEDAAFDDQDNGDHEFRG